MCRYYAFTYSCGHTQTPLFDYCKEKAFIQTACNPQSDTAKIAISLHVDHPCDECGGAKRGTKKELVY